jgi:hypothetical protein
VTLLEPLSLYFDVESVRRLVAFRVDPPIQARIEILGERANEGNLNRALFDQSKRAARHICGDKRRRHQHDRPIQPVTINSAATINLFLYAE